MKHLRLMLTSAAFSLSIMLTPVFADGPAGLRQLETKIARDYSGIAHMTPDELLKLGHDPDAMKDVLLIDVREQKEFEVSRIPNAVRVSPGTWTFSFLREFRERAKGKKIIFYCSVGVRSSKLAARVKSGLMESGAVEVANLKGGIFAWHNQGKALNSAVGRTNTVHPYNDYWGRLLAPAATRSFKPLPPTGARYQSIAPKYVVPQSIAPKRPATN